MPLSEHQEEQAVKALRDTHKFLLELDQLKTYVDYSNIKANARRVRGEVSHALQLLGKL